MRAWIIAFAIVASGQALDAGLETTNVYGIGGNSCASWLSSHGNETEGDIWVLGYWSGRNDANAANHKVGATTGADGIIGEVKKVCKDKPSLTLFHAVGRVWFDFLNGSR
jgi:hypothetical protein